MNNSDIQYMKLVKLLQVIEKRLTKIEEAVFKRGPGRPPKVHHEKGNAADG